MITYVPSDEQIQAVKQKAEKTGLLSSDETYILNRYILGMSEIEAKTIAYGLYEDVIVLN